MRGGQLAAIRRPSRAAKRGHHGFVDTRDTCTTAASGSTARLTTHETTVTYTKTCTPSTAAAVPLMRCHWLSCMAWRQLSMTVSAACPQRRRHRARVDMRHGRPLNAGYAALAGATSSLLSSGHPLRSNRLFGRDAREAGSGGRVGEGWGVGGSCLRAVARCAGSQATGAGARSKIEIQPAVLPAHSTASRLKANAQPSFRFCSTAVCNVTTLSATLESLSGLHCLDCKQREWSGHWSQFRIVL